MYCSYNNLAIDNLAGNAIIVASLNQQGVMAMTPKEKRSGLTASWLRENMDFDAAMGEFRWKLPGYGRTVGKVIGLKETATKTKNYRCLRINGTLFYAHRVAWLHHYGEWPAGLLDHIDGDKWNNAIANLRVATSAQNAARRRSYRSIAPSRGVFPHGAGYVARIHHAGKRHYLGYFGSSSEAQAAYEAKAKEIYGEFAHPAEPAPAPRGDYLKVPKCEMCGRDGNWGANDIRRDVSAAGEICGALCFDCWTFTYPLDHDKSALQRMYRLALSYFDKVDVAAPAPSAFDLIKAKSSAEIKPDG